MIRFNTLDQSAYATLLYQTIQESEGIKQAAYRDKVGIPSIGIGFNLRDDNIRGLVLDKLGVNPYGPDGIEFFQFDNLVLTRQELIELLGMNIGGTPEADVLSGTAVGDRIAVNDSMWERVA